MDNSQPLSEVLYVGLCRKIGTPSEVRIRRDVKDMTDMIDQNIPDVRKRGFKERRMLSGSSREGFMLKTSDKDYMIWCRRCKLVNEISQLRAYNSSNHNIFLIEDTYTPPGFVRLQLLTTPRDNVLRSSMIPLNDRIYLSSVLYKQGFRKEKFQGLQNLTYPGPCVTSNSDSLPIDAAVGFASKYWPKSTEHWIDRCLRQMWPPASVLKDILNNNYHFVSLLGACVLPVKVN